MNNFLFEISQKKLQVPLSSQVGISMYKRLATFTGTLTGISRGNDLSNLVLAGLLIFLFKRIPDRNFNMLPETYCAESAEFLESLIRFTC